MTRNMVGEFVLYNKEHLHPFLSHMHTLVAHIEKNTKIQYDIGIYNVVIYKIKLLLPFPLSLS